MMLRINGSEEEILDAKNLAELVSKRNLCKEKIIIEYNLQIVMQEKWEKTLLKENDAIEIVSFVGGG